MHSLARSFSKRRLWLLLCYAAIIMVSLTAAFALRFDLSIPTVELAVLNKALALAVALKLPVFRLARLHWGWRRFADLNEILPVLGANLVASALFTALGLLILGPWPPLSIYLIDFLICIVISGSVQLAYQLSTGRRSMELSKPKGKGILIYGAGVAGAKLLREIRCNPALGYEVVGFLDDDPEKRKLNLMGNRVLGSGRQAVLIVEHYRKHSRPIEEIVIAMPSATGRQMNEALANCRSAGVACRTLPGIGELLNGKGLTSQIRDLRLEDLLTREPIKLDDSSIQLSLTGRSILVTGGAGSIGSEICRQVARYRPGKLIIMDQAESELFKIELELRRRHPEVVLVPEVGDIRDACRVEDLISRHSVASIFHAAAYKHVPLMEAHLLEAVRNNVIGTWNLIRAAHRCQVANFLMISSDKAVNPTSIMGLTKRVAELIVSAQPGADRPNPPHFLSVRFGNVLGSNGSVVPIFQEQIAAGGPITVTHPEMRRYFMTIPEAVQLVLQASTMGNDSEIFVLDMGEPIRIVDLAHNMIRLMGLVPNEDIEIQFVGIRPGEKLEEELALHGEDLLATYHDKIKIFRHSQVLTLERLSAWLNRLEVLLRERDEEAVLNHLRKLVPEYRSDRVHTSETCTPAATSTAECQMCAATDSFSDLSSVQASNP
jgi:FlaA1/EpsC-like NDP-sugar epimerase